MPAVPAPRQYKTLYPRTMITGDLDTLGDYALKTSPIVYDRVWLHATAYGIEGLCRRGHYEEARQYFEAGFRWQGSQASEASRAYTAWEGFFTAPLRYTALLWLNYHGWFLNNLEDNLLVMAHGDVLYARGSCHRSIGDSLQLFHGRAARDDD